MLGNALIGLREGLEASLVVAILVAFLVKTDRRSELPRVWIGVGLAVLVSVGVTLGLTLAQQALTFEAQETLGGSLSIVAVGFVTWMIFWMRAHGRTLSREIEGRLDSAISMGPLAVVVVAALAVGREGLETAVFFFAAAQAAGQTTGPLIGFLTGIAIAVVLAYLIYRGAMRINLGRFFTVTGFLLVFVAAGILAYGVHDLQEAGALPGPFGAGAPIDPATGLVATGWAGFPFGWAFDVSTAVAPDSALAVLLQATVGFMPQMTWLQVIAWVVYVAVVVPLFVRGVRAGRRPRSAATSPSTVPAEPRLAAAPATAGTSTAP